MNSKDGLQRIVNKMEEERLKNWQEETLEYVRDVEESIVNAIILDKSFIRYEIDAISGMNLYRSPSGEDTHAFYTGREILKALSALNIEANVVGDCIVLPLPNFKVLPTEFYLCK